jgi:hypothetical protein
MRYKKVYIILILIIGALALFVPYIAYKFLFSFSDPYRDAGINAIGTYTNSLGMEFVEMPKGYYVSCFETKQKDFHQIMGYNNSNDKNPYFPVECVSSKEAIMFCVKLTEYERVRKALPEGFVYSLASYSEWLEFAGDASINDSNIGLNREYDFGSESYLKRVDFGAPNRLGLYCICGNVSEFSRDITAGNQGEKNNIILGSSFLTRDKYKLLLTHKAAFASINDKSLDVGFRVVLIPENQNVAAERRVGIVPN